MKRETWLKKILPGRKDEFLRRWETPWDEVRAAWLAHGYGNLSVWTVDDFAFGYYEIADGAAPSDADKATLARWDTYMEDVSETIAKPGDMRRMYHDIGIVREDKSLIRHRVFGTILKPGCAQEYYDRHKALIDARGDRISEGPESNFTIWCANDTYIFGYCELVKSFDREMTDEEKETTIAWETRQLEIMDWLTDDVDWITGDNHPAIHRAFQM